MYTLKLYDITRNSKKGAGYLQYHIKNLENLEEEKEKVNNHTIAQHLSIGMSYRICEVWKEGQDISEETYPNTHTTYRQTIYNLINIRIWSKGTGPQNWIRTKKYLDQHGIKYNSQFYGDDNE